MVIKLDGKEYVTTAEAGEKLGGVSASRVRHYIKDGSLTAVKVGHDTLVLLSSVTALAKKPREHKRGRKPKRLTEST